jgi:hypothetical protein
MPLRELVDHGALDLLHGVWLSGILKPPSFARSLFRRSYSGVADQDVGGPLC